MSGFLNKALSAFNRSVKDERLDKQDPASGPIPAHFTETEEQAWAREFNNGVTANDLGEIKLTRVETKGPKPSGMG